jgi:hypothetical protein
MYHYFIFANSRGVTQAGKNLLFNYDFCIDPENVPLSRYTKIQTLHMKKYPSIFPLVILALFITSCSRNNDDIQQPDPVIQNPFLTHTDSLTAITQLWKTVRDSLSSGGNYYWMENGSMHYPTPGVYLGQADDSYHFKANDSLVVLHQGYLFRITWSFAQAGKLNIPGMNVHGPAHIFKLTASELVLNWINTSPNGGTYYRRLYLKK